MQFIGYDIGSSSIKASVIDGDSGTCIASSVYPETEMLISSPHPGWAEQYPEIWWENMQQLTRELLKQPGVIPEQIKAVGISYQMHGLVLVDKDRKVLRPAIIWCDSRAVDLGEKAWKAIGKEKCMDHLLNAPGNFTASKLAWVKEHEPDIFRRVDKVMLPGDFMVMKLTGDINTTLSGLSEGIFWDFKKNKLSDDILSNFGFDDNLIPPVVPTFGEQGFLTEAAAVKLGIRPGIPISYRAGDQPNNAFSLNVLNPGEIAATAGTSGVVYGVSEERKYDPLSRINTFAHVNHQPPANIRLGVLMCINGTGILNAWLKRNMAPDGIDYSGMNELANKIPAGAEGLSIFPFGNGAERLLENKKTGAFVSGLDFNRHSRDHFYRAAQEGIAFSFRYGMDIMKKAGVNPKVIRAGHANMFLSPLFCTTLSDITGAKIEIYDTDGAQGAARGAAVGSGYFKSFKEAFISLEKIREYQPGAKSGVLNEIYENWMKLLQVQLSRDTLE